MRNAVDLPAKRVALAQNAEDRERADKTCLSVLDPPTRVVYSTQLSPENKTGKPVLLAGPKTQRVC